MIRGHIADYLLGNTESVMLGALLVLGIYVIVLAVRQWERETVCCELYKSLLRKKIEFENFPAVGKGLDCALKEVQDMWKGRKG